MKRILFALLCLSAMSFTDWQPDFETARKTAIEKHKLILLNFSGSDWCIPCIRMRKEFFDNSRFTQMSDSFVVLVNADFPRNKKNQPGKAVVAANEALADKYNAEGKFPFTVLLDTDGKVLKSWEGFPREDISTFVGEIKDLYNAGKQ